jgi:solute carrier family 25 (mitochondrial thiamine pyrophosphate transporter), member 19
MTSFVSGAAAGAAATLASYPFDLLRTVLAFQGKPALYRGMGDAALGIVRHRGVKGLFAGVGITLAEIVPYAGIQFGAYDLLKRSANDILAKKGVHELSPQADFMKQFCVGLLAGLAGKVRSSKFDDVGRYQPVLVLFLQYITYVRAR